VRACVWAEIGRGETHTAFRLLRNSDLIMGPKKQPIWNHYTEDGYFNNTTKAGRCRYCCESRFFHSNLLIVTTNSMLTLPKYTGVPPPLAPNAEEMDLDSIWRAIQS
jgi:hypothetical protein